LSLVWCFAWFEQNPIHLPVVTQTCAWDMQQWRIVVIVLLCRRSRLYETSKFLR
jgi:hypothetical protein